MFAGKDDTPFNKFKVGSEPNLGASNSESLAKDKDGGWLLPLQLFSK